jgi:hypothetical protein
MEDEITERKRKQNVKSVRYKTFLHVLFIERQGMKTYGVTDKMYISFQSNKIFIM